MPTIIIVILVVALGLVLCGCLAVANYSYGSYYEKFQKMNKIDASTQFNILEFFHYLNAKYFSGKIQIFQNPIEGGDAYAKGALYLSASTLNSSSLASFSIVAHEMGHALQDVNSNALKRMSFLRRFGRFIGPLFFPLLIAGVVLIIVGGGLFYWGVGLAAGAFGIFLLAIVTKALTIRIEKGASKNAVMFLKEVLPEKDVKRCKKFLSAAKLTYWGDMFRALFGWTLLTRKGKLFK